MRRCGGSGWGVVYSCILILTCVNVERFHWNTGRVHAFTHACMRMHAMSLHGPGWRGRCPHGKVWRSLAGRGTGDHGPASHHRVLVGATTPTRGGQGAVAAEGTANQGQNLREEIKRQCPKGASARMMRRIYIYIYIYIYIKIEGKLL